MHALTRLAAALALGLALLATSAPAIAQTEPQPLLLDLCIDARCVGIAVVVETGDRILVDRDALQAAGIDVAGIAPERIGGRDYIAVDRLYPGTRARIDHARLRLDLALPAASLPSQAVDLRQPRQAEAVTLPWTGFVNYAASAGSRPDDRSLFLDASLGRGHAAARSSAQWTAADGWRRGLSRIEFDQPRNMRRWTVGDQFATARDPLGGAVLLGGAGVERAFEQDPYLVRFPRPSYVGVLESPGTVEVYANGQLIARRELGAGPFTFAGLGIPPGRSDVRLVVRDPFGTRSELSSATYYASTSLLAAGLSDYAVRLGVPRSAALGGDYGSQPVLQAWYRRGLTDALTVGGRIEGDARLRNAGADAALRTSLGEFALALAASEHDRAGRGQAAALGYGFSARSWGVSLGARRFDRAYRALGDDLATGFEDGDFDDGDFDDALFARPREERFGTVSWSSRSNLSLQLSAGQRLRQDGTRERNAGLSGNYRIAPRAQLFFSLQRREVGAVRDLGGYLSLSFALDRDTFGVSVRHDDSGTGYGIDARRSRPPGSGWGYELNLQHDAGTRGFGQLEYQGRHGRYALQAERFGDDSRGRALASGALVAVGGRTYATPPLEFGSFALVRVPQLAGAQILRENLEVGRTDARGDLLVRDLIPYFPNRIGLDITQVPPGYRIVTAQRQFVVPRNAGALVELEVQPLLAATGRVRIDGGPAAGPARYGQLVLRDAAGAAFTSRLGGAGLFYFEHLPAGRYTGTVDSQGARALCTLDAPARATPGVTDLGELACTAPPAGSDARPGAVESRAGAVR